ncbi:MAG: AI-2E family transporter [Candidatus Acidiferrales bacterium]
MERILYLGLVGLFAYFIFKVFAPFLVPLTWAGLLVIMFYPVHRRVQGRIRQPNRAALVTTLLLTAVIIAPGLMVLGAFTTQAFELAHWVGAEWRQGRVPLHEVWEQVPRERIVARLAQYNITERQVNEFVTEQLQNLGNFMARQAGLLLRDFFYLLFDLFVMLFAAFYFFRDGPPLLERLRRALPLEEGTREGLFYIAYSVLYASVMSGLLVAAAQGTLGGLLFWLLGIDAAVLWGMVMGFLSLLPLFGAWLVWVPAVLYLLVKAHYVRAFILLVAGALIVSGIDNVLRPLLLSGRTQMNGLLVFISILGGVAAFGFLGILLGPILVAMAVVLFEVYTTRQPVPGKRAASDAPPAVPAS